MGSDKATPPNALCGLDLRCFSNVFFCSELTVWWSWSIFPRLFLWPGRSTREQLKLCLVSVTHVTFTSVTMFYYYVTQLKSVDESYSACKCLCKLLAVCTGDMVVVVVLKLDRLLLSKLLRVNIHFKSEHKNHASAFCTPLARSIRSQPNDLELLVRLIWELLKYEMLPYDRSVWRSSEKKGSGSWQGGRKKCELCTEYFFLKCFCSSFFWGGAVTDDRW